MIGMQYKVILPKDYDMEIIKKRVKDNGYKTDGFQDLNFKAYLITEADKDGNFYNCYAPLYIWNGHEGMNKLSLKGITIIFYNLWMATNKYRCSISC